MIRRLWWGIRRVLALILRTIARFLLESGERKQVRWKMEASRSLGGYACARCGGLHASAGEVLACEAELLLEAETLDAMPHHCGTPMIPILYGYPSRTGHESAARGEVVLGGCVVHDDAPNWECRVCGEQVHVAGS